MKKKEETKAANQPKEVTLLTSEIVQISTDRSAKDVGIFRHAHISAESIHYPNRTRLYDLYSDIELDGHLTGIINKRIDTVLNKEFSFKRKNEKDEDVQNLIESNEFRNMIRNILYSKMQGIVAFEFIPGQKFCFKVIPRKHIKPEKKVITINQSDYEGTPYEGLSNVWVIGEERDLGVLLQCCFYALIKKGNFADWAQFSEIFGQPVRVGKYDANDDGTRIQLKKALTETGGSLAIMIPKQAEFDIIDGKTSNANGELQERLKNACNNEMSIVVLGNTETTGNDNGGSNAKAKEQRKDQLEITKSDLVFVRNLLNSEKFLNILASYGYKVDGGRFEVEKDIDITILQQKAIVDTTIVGASKLPVSDDYWYETYSIAKPDNYDELKAKQEEERIAQQQQFNNQFKEVEPDNKKAFSKKEDEKIKPKNLSTWDNFRNKLADFFAQAHED